MHNAKKYDSLMKGSGGNQLISEATDLLQWPP